MEDRRLGNIMIIFGIFLVLAGSSWRALRPCIGCSYSFYAIIWFIGAIIVSIGWLLRRSEELHENIKESQLKVNKEFRSIKAKERQKKEFRDFLEGFNNDEREVIEFLHTYEGATLALMEKETPLNREQLDKVIRKLQKLKIISVMDGKAYLLRMS